MKVVLKVLYKLALAYWFVFRPKTKGSYVAVWWNEKVLLIKNSYKKVLTLPSGGVKNGESFRVAAKRELFEGVGIEVEKEKLIFFKKYLNRSEYKKDKVCFFEIFLKEKPKIKIDNKEVIEAYFLDKKEIKKQKLFPTVNDYLQEKFEAKFTNCQFP